MTTCEYCGQLVSDGLTVCPHCGGPVTIQPVVQQNTTLSQGYGNYRIILCSLGTCAPAAAADLMEDIFGYTEAQSMDMFSVLPAQLAQSLTYEQARYAAQAMSEYGMETSVRDNSGYVAIDDDINDSIFDSAGKFIGKVASVLGTITGLNRMLKFRRWDDPGYKTHLFCPAYRRPEPVIHVRRPITHKEPERRPVQPMPAHRPQSYVSHDYRRNDPGRSGMSGQPHHAPGGHNNDHGGPGAAGGHAGRGAGSSGRGPGNGPDGHGRH